LAGLLTRKGKKARQDALAAATMLQDFLNSASAGSDTAPKSGEK
jgi:RNase H-fold protein (predicted Holliday junction resolvase)